MPFFFYPGETGTFVYSPPRFVGYQKIVADLIGDNCTFVDHFNAVALMYEQLGNETVNDYYPSDHTHTSPTGANKVAEAFVQAIATKMNGTTSLVDYIITDYATVY